VPPRRPGSTSAPVFSATGRNARGTRARAIAAAEIGACDAISSVLVSFTGARATWGKTERSVAVSVFSSVSEVSGWPTLMITIPRGFRWSRTSSKNSFVVR
jgi:hypothetical protein